MIVFGISSESTILSGRTPNPTWDQSDPANVQFAATLFGVHLFINMAFSIVLFVLIKLFTKQYNVHVDVFKRRDIKFQQLPMIATDENEELVEDTI